MDSGIFNHISSECYPSGTLTWTPAAEIMNEQTAQVNQPPSAAVVRKDQSGREFQAASEFGWACIQRIVQQNMITCFHGVLT